MTNKEKKFFERLSRQIYPAYDINGELIKNYDRNIILNDLYLSEFEILKKYAKYVIFEIKE